MLSRRSRPLPLLAAILLAAGSARAEELPKLAAPSLPAGADAPAPVKRGFITHYLTPQIDRQLAADEHAAVESADRFANPWLRDTGTASRIGHDAVRATGHALKNWALDRLDLQSLGFTMTGRAPASTPFGEHASVRFGFAHMAPRAEMLFPSARGKFRFSADLRGRLATGFDTPTGGLRFGVTLDPLRHGGTIGLTKTF